MLRGGPRGGVGRGRGMRGAPRCGCYGACRRRARVRRAVRRGRTGVDGGRPGRDRAGRRRRRQRRGLAARLPAPGLAARTRSRWMVGVCRRRWPRHRHPARPLPRPTTRARRRGRCRGVDRYGGGGRRSRRRRLRLVAAGRGAPARDRLPRRRRRHGRRARALDRSALRRFPQTLWTKKPPASWVDRRAKPPAWTAIHNVASPRRAR